jgi:hypothetical protein
MAPVASEKGTASHPRHMLQHVTPPNPERGSVTHKHTPLIRGVRYVTPPPVKSRRRRLNPFYAPSDACALVFLRRARAFSELMPVTRYPVCSPLKATMVRPPRRSPAGLWP